MHDDARSPAMATLERILAVTAGTVIAPTPISEYANSTKGVSMLTADAGRLVRGLRRRSGLNQARLAIRAGTTTSAISRLERGHVSPTVATLETLLLCLGYRLDLQALPFEVGIDPTQLQAVSAMTPTERLDHALASQRSLAELVGAARE